MNEVLLSDLRDYVSYESSSPTTLLPSLSPAPQSPLRGIFYAHFKRDPEYKENPPPPRGYRAYPAPNEAVSITLSSYGAAPTVADLETPIIFKPASYRISNFKRRATVQPSYVSECASDQFCPGFCVGYNSRHPIEHRTLSVS